jgi:glutathione S-transferase
MDSKKSGYPRRVSEVLEACARASGRDAAKRGYPDSTPIIEHLEAFHREPSIHPTDPVTHFVSILLEEFGDEWGNKRMFHYRWAREVDQLSGAGRITRSMMPTADEVQLANGIAMVRDRMVNRVSFVGSNPVTAPQIEDSFRDALAILEPHFADRSYLFGQRPAFADFAMWGQLYNAWTDPMPGAMINATTPNLLLAWIPSDALAPSRRRLRAVVKPCSNFGAVA